MAGAAGPAQNLTSVREARAARTLVKSPPELWAACSDVESLARHLGGFGEIRITRLEPETTVAWEGDRASGTVTLEQSGWGTKVTMTAVAAEDAPDVEDEPVADEAPDVEEAPVIVEDEAGPVPEADQAPVIEEEEIPVVDEAPVAEARPGFFARLFRRWRPPPEQAPEPLPPKPVFTEPDPPPDAAATESVLPEPEAPPTEQEALDAALDSLGQAHHRPFSQH